jgi:hypothetical protein
MEFPIVRRTDRDLELPAFSEFLERTTGKIQSVLDIGAHYSAGYYALELRNYVKKYIALDPNFDGEVAEIVDEFIQKNALEIELPQTDLVMCLSTIEHVGHYPIKYYDFMDKRLELFYKMLNAAQKYFWISFPLSKFHTIENEMTPITPDELTDFLKAVENYKVTQGYFWSEGPQAGHPWTKSSKEKLINEDYIDSLGNRGICILEIEK